MPTSSQPAWIRTIPIAHRGLHDATRPENSLGAFAAAVDAGYAIELDVHLTADNQLAVIHDPDTLRATGEALNVRVEPLARLAELRLFETEYGVTTLPEVMKLVAGRVPLYIEVKTGTPAKRVGPIVAALIDSYDGDVAVLSFDPRIILWFKRNASHVLRGLLSGSMDYPEDHLNWFVALTLRSLVSTAFCRPQIIAYDVNALPSRALAFWRWWSSAEVLLWPADTEDELRIARAYDANVIFETVRPTIPR